MVKIDQILPANGWRILWEQGSSPMIGWAVITNMGRTQIIELYAEDSVYMPELESPRFVGYVHESEEKHYD